MESLFALLFVSALIFLIGFVPIFFIVAIIKNVYYNKLNKRNKQHYSNNLNKRNVAPQVKTEEEHRRELKQIYPNTTFSWENPEIMYYDDKQNDQNANVPTYAKKSLLSQYETKLYNILLELINCPDFSNLTIISKIRLADLIESNNKYSYSDFNKIKSKHIDFALCDKHTLMPLLLIELDDNSHNQYERRQRDDFVNQSLVQSGYKVLRIKNIDKERIKMQLYEIINSNLPGVFYI
ncbi:DUF2726 domain-containing protein [uncultured Eubacterium sp.]|uniref:DUF2726 domain-containing protein n=1 Tax=uncultured Eubacterium sp. TaxID=165185 RepID=UPI002805CC05|nr:DUF2726 domain-containing protein [uncultured Eubacterium sp.]